jgi:GntR family transcriptional regulator, transcriptional repressor for pyruvate dehydrogenase complex
MSPEDEPMFLLSPDQHQGSRSAAVLNRLADLISEGRLAAGDTLPPESDLATQFRVSKPTVREALRKLEVMGVVEIVHGRGSSIRRISAEPLQFFLRLAVGSLEGGIAEIIEFRRAIEVSAAGLAAVNGTEDQHAELKRIMAHMKAAATEHDNWVAWDLAFHAHVAAMTGNTLMAFMVEAMRPIMRQSISMLHGQKQLRDAEKTLARHVDIAEAIGRRDAGAARISMQNHFDASVPVAISLSSRDSKGGEL